MRIRDSCSRAFSRVLPCRILAGDVHIFNRIAVHIGDGAVDYTVIIDIHFSADNLSPESGFGIRLADAARLVRQMVEGQGLAFTDFQGSIVPDTKNVTIVYQPAGNRIRLVPQDRMGGVAGILAGVAFKHIVFRPLVVCQNGVDGRGGPAHARNIGVVLVGFIRIDQILKIAGIVLCTGVGQFHLHLNERRVLQDGVGNLPLDGGRGFGSALSDNGVSFHFQFVKIKRFFARLPGPVHFG